MIVAIKSGVEMSFINAEFKKGGLKLTQEDGSTDLYKYAWLIKHETRFTND